MRTDCLWRDSYILPKAGNNNNPNMSGEFEETCSINSNNLSISFFLVIQRTGPALILLTVIRYEIIVPAGWPAPVPVARLLIVICPTIGTWNSTIVCFLVTTPGGSVPEAKLLMTSVNQLMNQLLGSHRLGSYYFLSETNRLIVTCYRADIYTHLSPRQVWLPLARW